MTSNGATREELLKQIFAMEKLNTKVTTPEDVYLATEKWARKRVEFFLAVLLNSAHGIISIEVVSQGLANRTIVHPRETFRKAIVKNAAAIILVHNHPSGAVQPSNEDRDITKRLRDAGSILGIEVLDHLIISRIGYYSFTEHGI